MFLIDAHNDTAYRMWLEKEHLFENHLHIDIKKQKGSTALLLFAIFMDPVKMKEFSTPFAYFEEIYQNFMVELSKNKDTVELVTSSRSFPHAKKHLAMLGVEGGSLIDSLEDVELLFQKKIKVLTLTWNDSNKLAKSAVSGERGGLSPFGKQVIFKMNTLGMVADLSHASDETFFDVLNHTKKPILVSHSNARALCPHPRNITDEMFRALMENGGVLGINFYPPFLGEGADISTIFSHIEHFLQLGGENHLGFGSDFDGVDCLPCGFSDITAFSAIQNEMIRRNYPSHLIEKIFSENMKRVLS